MMDVCKVKHYIILRVLLRYNLQENKEEVDSFRCAFMLRLNLFYFFGHELLVERRRCTKDPRRGRWIRSASVLLIVPFKWRQSREAKYCYSGEIPDEQVGTWLFYFWIGGTGWHVSFCFGEGHRGSLKRARALCSNALSCMHASLRQAASGASVAIFVQSRHAQP